jgi:hypothetical protein
MEGLFLVLVNKLKEKAKSFPLADRCCFLSHLERMRKSHGISDTVENCIISISLSCRQEPFSSSFSVLVANIFLFVVTVPYHMAILHIFYQNMIPNGMSLAFQTQILLGLDTVLRLQIVSWIS